MALKAGSTIGILGGGQLGRMLAMAAARFSYRIVIFDPDPLAPAAQLASDHVRAQYDDVAALEAFARRCDVVTFEFENVPVAAAKLINAITPVFPGPKALEVAQDRIHEKTFLNAAGVATAPFWPVDSPDDLEIALDRLGGSGVLKTRRMGYDGKGQVVLKQASGAMQVNALADLGGNNLIIEGLAPFASELSVIAARARDGSVRTHDPASNVHRNGMLAISTVPAAVSASTCAAAVEATRKILSALDYVGVLGVEFFVLESGEILANEIAPRVHNSGHWTEAACAISQFEQHVRAIAGLPLGDPRRHSDCVMENLVGSEIERVEALCAQSNVFIHLYGKDEARAGRKMGHFTRLLPKT